MLHLITGISCLEQCAVRFEEKNGELPIDYDGIPFVILGTEVRECQYGQDRSMPQTKVWHYVNMPIQYTAIFFS